VADYISHLSDNELHLLYKQEDNMQAYTLLFERYYTIVYGICMKYLQDSENAKDATMQIFEKMINDLKVHDIQYFKAWLYMVSKNFCLMQLRSKMPLTKQIELIEPYIVENEESIHLIHEKERQLNNMHDAMTHLPIEQRQCIGLFYLEKKTYEQICNETGFTFMQVKSFIQNGKRNLKQKLTIKENE
jgi:RNA polymerase sigma-70 factor (ECF subfamily)